MSSESNYSITVKVGPRGDLLTVRGDTSNEFQQHLSNLLLSATLLQNIEEFIGLAVVPQGHPDAGAAPYQAAAQAVTQAFPTAQVQPNTAPTPPPAQPGIVEQAGTPVCQHGPKVWREGVSSKGPWKAWMCPSPKGTPGQCPPDFIR
jgi:hypothetical protein